VALARETHEQRVEEEQMMVALEMAGVPESLRGALLAFFRARGLGLGAVRKCGWELRGLLDRGASEDAVVRGLQAVPSGLREWNAWWEAVKRIQPPTTHPTTSTPLEGTTPPEGADRTNDGGSGGTRQLPLVDGEQPDPRVTALRDIAAEEFRRVGFLFGWSYERDGSNAKCILAQLDAQPEALRGLDPLEAFRLTVQEFLADERAASKGYPLAWLWKAWDTYLRRALKNRRHEVKMVDWEDVTW
jgi:hypothetical protein